MAVGFKIRAALIQFTQMHNNFKSIEGSQMCSCKKKRHHSKRTQATVSEPKQETRQYRQIRRQPQIQRYFRNLLQRPNIGDKIAREVENEGKIIIREIKRGELEISPRPVDASKLLMKEEPDEQLIKEAENKKKRDKLLAAISRLDMRQNVGYESLGKVAKKFNKPDMLKYVPNSILTKEEHEELVEKIRYEQKLQDERAAQRLLQLQRKIRQDEQRQKRQREDKINAEKQFRRKQSEYRLEVRKQILQIQNAEQERSRRELLQLKNKTLLHKKLEQNFNNNFVIPVLEDKKKKLKQIRDRAKGFTLNEVDEHERRYLQERSKSLHSIYSRAKLNAQSRYKAPEKTQTHSRVIEGDKANLKNQLHKSQVALEEKIRRQENFEKMLKQKYKPKVSQQLHEEVLNNIEHIHTKKRQSKVDAREVGINYLSEAKKKKRRTLSQKQLTSHKQTENVTASRINYLTRSETMEYYRQKKIQTIDRLIKSDKESKDKVNSLRTQIQKIEDETKRKEDLLKIKRDSFQARQSVAGLMLSKIKAKMALVNIQQ